MLQRVELGQLRLDAYREIIGDEAVEAILRAAAPLRGLRVLHVNATAFGGGVAEILGTLVPLMADVGLEAEWRIIEGSDAFFEVTKACHNGLQGMDLPFTAEMQATWRQYNALNARWFEGEFDVVVVHDPQPLGLLSFTEGRGARHWVWRCHIDTSEPNPAYWDFFKPYIEGYRAVIFTMREYVGPGVEASRVHVIPPSIDPLSPKNRPVAFATARQAMVRFGIDQARPVALQVSRFDPWKDQLGVIDAYREAKETEEGLQLALIGSLASDDPEAGRYLGRVRERAGGDPDIHIYQNLPSEEVAAFQAGSDVVLQKSLREGFGLTVSETLWKGRPVIGGRAGGIPLQIIDGENGFLVTTVAECADRILYLVHVRRNFVITRLLADYLELFGALMQVGEANGREAGAEAPTG
jgi:trehalose synthase